MDETFDGSQTGNGMIYLHETIEIYRHNRTNYMDHMAAYAPTARRDKGERCLGIWGTVGSTGGWPEVINMWEMDGWAGVAANFRFELGHPSLQDPEMAAWWAEAAQFREGGFDRLLIPAPFTPALEEAVKRQLHGETYHHQTVRVVPGQARTYLAMLEAYWLPIADRFGFQLVGAYRTALVNDSEVIILSAVPTWEDWGRYESVQDSDPDILDWRRRTAGLAIDWHNKLLCASVQAPTRTGVLL